MQHHLKALEEKKGRSYIQGRVNLSDTTRWTCKNKEVFVCLNLLKKGFGLISPPTHTLLDPRHLLHQCRLGKKKTHHLPSSVSPLIKVIRGLWREVWVSTKLPIAIAETFRTCRSASYRRPSSFTSTQKFPPFCYPHSSFPSFEVRYRTSSSQLSPAQRLSPSLTCLPTKYQTINPSTKKRPPILDDVISPLLKPTWRALLFCLCVTPFFKHKNPPFETRPRLIKS